MTKSQTTAAKTKPTPKRTVDIFSVLKQIDARTEDFYDRLADHEQRQLHPLVLARWMSGTSDPNAILVLNATSNKYNFALAPHKPLLMRMLLLTASGRSRRYNWNARNTKSARGTLTIRAIRGFYQCSQREAEMYKVMHSASEIVEMGEYVGLNGDELKSLAKELE